jgi:hypothetical protein
MQTKNPKDGFHALAHAGIFTFAGYTRTVPYDSRSRLPILHSVDGAMCYLTTESENSPVLKENLTNKQRTLLRWHNRLAHMNFNKIQDLA